MINEIIFFLFLKNIELFIFLYLNFFNLNLKLNVLVISALYYFLNSFNFVKITYIYIQLFHIFNKIIKIYLIYIFSIFFLKKISKRHKIVYFYKLVLIKKIFIYTYLFLGSY